MEPDPPATKFAFVLCPGWVTSVNDGDRHFIDFIKLKNCYGLHVRDCINSSSEYAIQEAVKRGLRLIYLHPLYSGNYRETLEKRLAFFQPRARQ